jgi:hypothetical protein
MTSPIPAIYKSIIRATSRLIADMNAAGVGPISYHNWEERGEEIDLPKTTLLGVDGFSFDENQGFWIIRYALGLSTYNDANLSNEIDMVGYIHDRFKEGNSVELLDLATVTADNILHISDFKVMPMGQSELRNYRTIGIELLRAGV